MRGSWSHWSRDLRRRRVVVEAVSFAVVLVVAVLAFAAHFASSPRRADGDTYYYLSQALEFSGAPAERARQQAGQIVCAEVNRPHRRDPAATPECTRYQVNSPERYVAIFTSRPGWPLLVAPFVGLLGPWRGAVVATLLLAVLAAALVYAALRLVTGPVAAAAGAVTFSLLGTGIWAAWLHPEGAVFAWMALALLGVTTWLRGNGYGLPVVAVALVLLYACKPANGAAMSAALLAAGLVLTVLNRRNPRRAALLAGAGAVGLGGWVLVSRLLGLPSLQDTLQDLATRHYAMKDVADPWYHLRHVDELLWTVQLNRWLGIPQPLPILLAAAVVAVVTLRATGVLWALVAVSAVGVVVLHPLISQYDRLLAPAWLTVCAAVAGVVALLGRQLPRLLNLSTGASPLDRDDRQQRTGRAGAS